MGILEEIGQQKNQGIPEDQIVINLKEKGYSPKEITDAISQSQIKSAITPEEKMTPDIQDPYTPQTQEMAAPPQEVYQDYSGGEQGYAPAYGSGGTYDPGISMEIAEQVFLEKSKKIQNQIQELTELKTIVDVKITDLDNRLKKIESTIDKLQISILEKIGSYGQGIDTIKKEMSMMQDSFGKVVNQAVKNSQTQTTPSEPTQTTPKK